MGVSCNYMVDHPPIRLRITLPDDAIDVSDFSLNHERNRNTLRSLIINEFLKEQPGTGKGPLTSKYRYDVEELSDGRKVYLIRPAYLNKGFDFVINVEGATFLNGGTVPKHADISSDIRTKLAALSPDLQATFKQQMLELAEKIFYGIETDEIMDNYELEEEFNDLPGLDYEIILRVIKWFFIEQDVCYWNWSGRAMFMKGLRELLA